MKQNNSGQSQAAEAFSAQSVVFDAMYRASPIVAYMRNRIYHVLNKHIPPNSHILELNAGTGEDALWLAAHGHTVMATDASPGMLAQQREKFAASPNKERLTSYECSFLELEKLSGKHFDAIYSNFGGLNCTDQLHQVLADADHLLKPGGTMCLVIMPPNCLWEWTWALKGRFNKAFRRWKKGGTPAHIEGHWFTTWYYRPSFVRNTLKHYKRIKTEALCLAVPAEPFKTAVTNRPRLFKVLQRIEGMIKSWPVLRGWGDYFVLVLQKPN